MFGHDANRQRMLANMHRFWIAGLLSQSLKGGDFINPTFHLKVGPITPDADGDDALPLDMDIGALYDRLDESLLILGEPGSGKTTALLELTDILLQRAAADPRQPIPVIFNLASWAKDRLPFHEWLVEEFLAKYQVPRKIAREWVAQEALALLLDGLDEVATPYRDQCVSAIKAYRRQHPNTPLVLCSRTRDYAQLSQRLDVAGALVIQPFQDEQIVAYLDSLGPNADPLSARLARDEHLRELARTPLMLHIMATVVEELQAEAHFATSAEWRDYLFDLYIQQMFARRPKAKSIPPQETIGELRWLAQEMERRWQTVFYIESLGLDWLPQSHQRALYALLSRLGFGVIVGALAGGVATLIGMVLAWLLSGQTPVFFSATVELSGLFALAFYTVLISSFGALVGGIFFGAAGVLAYTVERVKHKSGATGGYLRRAAEVLALGAGGGLAFGVGAFLCIGLANLSFNLWFGDGVLSFIEALLYFVRYGVAFGLVGSLIALATDAILKRMGRPLTQLVYGVGGGFVAWAWLGIITLFNPNYIVTPMTLIVVWLLGGLVGLLAGGFRDDVVIAESVRWRWNGKWATVGLVIGGIIAALDFLFISSYGGQASLARLVHMFVPFGIFGLLVGGVGAGLRKNELVESRVQPNDGIRKSARNALRTMSFFGVAGIAISVAVLLSSAAVNINIGDGFRAVMNAVIVGLAGGMAAGLVMGGSDAVIKHLVLRLLLARDPRIPLNLARRLDHAANLILLRKVGGGYMFIHRYLLEYFAQLPQEAPEEKAKTGYLPAPDDIADEAWPSDGEAPLPNVVQRES